MKTKISILIMALSLFVGIISASAQQAQPQIITPYQLGITYSKTTNIVFPQPIISVDRGSRDVLAQKAKGVENILQVKAARDSFPETNLTVVTADGKLNSFIVNYSRQPAQLNLFLASATSGNDISLSPEHYNAAEIQKYAKAARYSKDKGKVIRDSKAGIEFSVEGFFIGGDIIYCRVNIENRTNIGYDIDQLRFFIRDQQKAKRTATQEIEITPVHIENNSATIKAQSQRTLVFALPKFTIPDKKYLAVQLVEKNGGRQLEVHVKNRQLIKARLLP
ncbi:conjugative transposon protein TraN [Flavobacterium zepuense]|uniref:Conjugative transposon protein TraN n=1 Tax=Flavobacterium zepuense TaxID=2593302 RepID=A0A552UUQ7_9FLAO|nr:conjugative transposon protein TraN [Flavobacterium zepuense]TRW21966.1 conjugative transposon protein TraN [Flavobacterium zepuense]